MQLIGEKSSSNLVEEVLSVGKPFAFFTDTCFEVDSCFHVVENLKNTGELNKLELKVVVVHLYSAFITSLKGALQ